MSTPSTHDEAVQRRTEDEGRKRLELIVAATNGVRAHLQTTRGANDFRNAKLITTSKGFVVQYGNDDRIYFETTHM